MDRHAPDDGEEPETGPPTGSRLPTSTLDTVGHRLLIAASDELEASGGWREVTVRNIARRAKLSRAAIYRVFGTRGGLARALIEHDAKTLRGAVARALGQHDDDPAVALSAAFELARHSVLVGELTRDAEETGLLSAIAPDRHELMRRAIAQFALMITAQWPATPSETAASLSEFLLRICVSDILVPPSRGAPCIQRSLRGICEASQLRGREA